MKIVHISQYYDDNAGYQENIFPSYQAKLGCDVTVITSTLRSGFIYKDREVAAGEYTENGFTLKRIPVNGELKNRFVIFNDLFKYLSEEKPDYIYHYSITAPSIKDVAKYKKENPNVFFAVDNHADLNNSGKNKVWKVIYYNFFWRMFLHKYDAYVNVYFGASPNRCLFMEEELGVPKDKIRLLPIGSDEDNAKVSMSKEDFFKKFNLDKDKFIITNGGKITPEKEVSKILEAFSRIRNEDINLVLFGRIADPKVEQLIKKDNRIKYIGWLNRQDTLAMLSYSDIGIWNKLHTTLLEDSVAVGLPLILRYYGNTSYLIKDSGLYLYEGSVREIQDKLAYVVNNRQVVQEFMNNSHKLLQILSYNNIAKESIEYMESMTPKTSHQIFMSQDCTDFAYKDLRFIK